MYCSFSCWVSKPFIHANFVDECKFCIVKSTNLYVEGFESAAVSKMHNIVNVPIQCNNEQIIIEAVVVNEMPNRSTMSDRNAIAEKLSSRGINRDDNANSEKYSNMSLIIGVDNYFKFMFNNRVDTNLDPIDSKVGVLIASTSISNTTK